MVAWLAPFVRDQGGLDIRESGWILSSVYFGQTFIVFLVAMLSRTLLAANFGSRVGRGFVMAGCLLLSAVAFAMITVTDNTTINLILMTVATTLPGSIFTICAAMISEVTPPSERNRLVTIIFALATLSALVSPAIAGYGIELGAANGWRPALLVLSGVALTGGALVVWLLRPDETRKKFGV